MSKKDTTVLDSSELRYLLIDSLKRYSEDVEFISGHNPYAFLINREMLYIFIHNVHSSGRGRTNKDECRIQVNRTKNFNEAQSTGKPVLFFGYFADENVFTAWNPYYFWDRINRKSVVSLYSRFSVQQAASAHGMSVYTDTNEQNIISFKPEHLGLYLENFGNIHLLDETGLNELIAFSDTTPETEEDIPVELEISRERFLIHHKRFKRNPQFRTEVLKAYQYRCAVCGISLDLVEAAHIIPHSHEIGNDDVGNGICLCSLHHKAYDNGLIYIDKDYVIRQNEDKIRYLEKMKLDGGIMKFMGLMSGERIDLPSSRTCYPKKEFLTKANHIRGIED